MNLVLWLLACGSALTSVRVDGLSEPSDVPPPPEHRTLQLHGVAPGVFPLGEKVAVRDARGTLLAVGEVVVDSADPPSVTLYVPEAQAEAALAHEGPVHATR